MSKFAIFFTFKSEALARLIDQPSDRVASVSRAVEQVNGTVEAYYWMFGQHDGFVVVEVPDSLSVAAVSLGVASSGAFDHLETLELLDPEQLSGVLAHAKDVRQQYRPPGD